MNAGDDQSMTFSFNFSSNMFSDSDYNVAFDSEPQNDGQELNKKKISSEESAGIPVIDTEEYSASSLKDQAKKMRKENRMLNSELKQLANSCMQISEENKFLLDDLKQICAPNVIAMLEAKNPGKKPQK